MSRQSAAAKLLPQPLTCLLSLTKHTDKTTKATGGGCVCYEAFLWRWCRNHTVTQSLALHTYRATYSSSDSLAAPPPKRPADAGAGAGEALPLLWREPVDLELARFAGALLLLLLLPARTSATEGAGGTVVPSRSAMILKSCSHTACGLSWTARLGVCSNRVHSDDANHARTVLCSAQLPASCTFA